MRETLRAVSIKFNFTTLELSPHIDFVHGNIFMKIKQHQNIPIEGHARGAPSTEILMIHLKFNELM